MWCYPAAAAEIVPPVALLIKLLRERRAGQRQIVCELLLALLGESRAEVRAAALDALARVAPRLLERVRAEAEETLYGEPPGPLLGPLHGTLIARGIGELGQSTPALTARLGALLDAPFWETRAAAASALGAVGRALPDAVLRRLLELRRDPAPAVRACAEEALVALLSLESGIEDG